MELYGRVRRACHVEGMSVREAARVFGLHRDTVRKRRPEPVEGMLMYSLPPRYRRSEPAARPRLDPFTVVIDRILEENEARPGKQRYTAKRILERLREDRGFTGGYTIVNDRCHLSASISRSAFAHWLYTSVMLCSLGAPLASTGRPSFGRST